MVLLKGRRLRFLFYFIIFISWLQFNDVHDENAGLGTIILSSEVML